MGLFTSRGMFTTIGEIQSAMIDLCEYLHVPCDDGEKYKVIYNRLLEACPKLHSQEELKKLSEEFINDFLDVHGHKKLRIWYESIAPLVFSDETLHMKYYNLLKNLNNWVYNWVENKDLIIKLDVYIFGNEVKKSYKEAGIGFEKNDWTIQLWGILRTLYYSDYNEVLMKELKDYIKNLLYTTKNKYYLKQEYNKNNLKDLYLELSEVIHANDAFQGHDMFYSYDGYGGVYLNI